MKWRRIVLFRNMEKNGMGGEQDFDLGGNKEDLICFNDVLCYNYQY